MAELLELPQLPQRDGVAEVDVEAGRVDAVLDAQRLAGRDAAFELLACSSSLAVSICAAPRRMQRRVALDTAASIVDSDSRRAVYVLSGQLNNWKRPVASKA